MFFEDNKFEFPVENETVNMEIEENEQIDKMKYFTKNASNILKLRES